MPCVWERCSFMPMNISLRDICPNWSRMWNKVDFCALQLYPICVAGAWVQTKGIYHWLFLLCSLPSASSNGYTAGNKINFLKDSKRNPTTDISVLLQLTGNQHWAIMGLCLGNRCNMKFVFWLKITNWCKDTNQIKSYCFD